MTVQRYISATVIKIHSNSSILNSLTLAKVSNQSDFEFKAVRKKKKRRPRHQSFKPFKEEPKNGQIYQSIICFAV